MTALIKTKPLPRVVAPSSNVLIPGELCLVTIPMSPPAEVSPNYHGHRMARAKAVKAYREAARLATVSVVNQAVIRSWERPFPFGTRLAVKVVIGWPRGHKRLDEVSNLPAVIKACEDGFADAIGVDDRHFTRPVIEQVRDQEGHGWTRIEAYAITEETDEQPDHDWRDAGRGGHGGGDSRPGGEPGAIAPGGDSGARP